MQQKPNPATHKQPEKRVERSPTLLRIYGPLAVFFLLLGGWLIADLKRGYDKALTDNLQRVMQRSQIISQSFRTQILASDYVLGDVLGRIQAHDVVYPDPDPVHAQQLTRLLKQKADTVPDFFSMVIFDSSCVFTATMTGQNTGVRSKPALCEARKAHQGNGPMATYVPGATSVSGKSVLVLSRHLTSAAGEFQGGVMGVIELDIAQHWFRSLSVGPGDSVALLDTDQTLLARHPVVTVALEKRVATPEVPSPLRAVATTTGASSAAQPDVDGRERLFGFSKVEGFPFVVAYGLDKAKVLEQWQSRAVEFALGYAALLLTALVAAWYQRSAFLQRETLRASEEHFRLLAENMADIVWRADAHMRFTYINAADERVRGFAREAVLGTTLKDNLTPQGQTTLDEVAHERRAIELTPSKGTALKYELPMRHTDGGDVWVEISSVPVYGSDGRISGYQGVGRDISRRKQQEAQLLASNHQLENELHKVAEEKSALQELATLDPLTGIYNRRFLDAALPRELARAQRTGQPLAVIMLDLDHFKRVNDQHGHAAGDEVLKALAQLLKAGARESDLICRYGGEEFVAVMPSMSTTQARERVESWRKQLESTPVLPTTAPNARITLSAGVAMFPTHGDGPEQLLARADEMLYKSKQEGRNRVTVCAGT